MFNRIPLLIAVLALFVIGAGCSKQEDVVPPFGSTITMPDDSNVTAGNTVILSAVVQDPDGDVMNGIGVIFRSSSNKASFSSSSIVSQTTDSTDENGIATVNVYTFSNMTGTAIIYGDIKVDTDSTTLTIKQ